MSGDIAPDPSSATGLLAFPCREKGRTWSLTQTDLDQLAELYEGIDILAIAKNALRWIVADPTRRKTERGYRRFLHDWVRRDVDRGTAPLLGSVSHAEPPAADAPRHPFGKVSLDGSKVFSGQRWVELEEFERRFPGWLEQQAKGLVEVAS